VGVAAGKVMVSKGIEGLVTGAGAILQGRREDGEAQAALECDAKHRGAEAVGSVLAGGRVHGGAHVGGCEGASVEVGVRVGVGGEGCKAGAEVFAANVSPEASELEVVSELGDGVLVRFVREALASFGRLGGWRGVGRAEGVGQIVQQGAR
jgi:hypothetical protein